MSVPEKIRQLVERFRRNPEAYKSTGYNETQLRREFVDPFFKALGWDVDNEQGHAEAYKDVVHEDRVKVGGHTKAPDYAFRIGGTRKFFVETKAPSKDLKQDPAPAYQVRRYAWNAKLPLSILTDFEEFAVYDCRVRPKLGDKASVARTIYVRFDEYTERWGEIAELFSRDAILKGAFDAYVVSQKKKRGTMEVDDAFLLEIEGWREALARNLAIRNEGLGVRELNFAVQRTIDRIIFLRICEDRGIEQYERLRALLNGGRVYARLGELFEDADERYNSGLFHFRKERGRGALPDELTLGLTIDDKVLKDIIRALYYPESPYEFAEIPPEILGQVYERFLGKVIRLTAGHRAKVEDKPEVRKAGGVYYTPSYIVDYIVEHTVGRLLEGKTPKQAEKLKIVDPACGSGSFLLGAYQRLLDWHRDYCVEKGPKRHTTGKMPKLYQASGGEWRLTTAEKKRILLNNIYGVDIDPQAVEITKLSLLLKVLEGESGETLQTYLRLFRERALPDLGNNIKCGNSLIGPHFLKTQQLTLLDEEEMYRINAFDWEVEFRDIMAAGGFDAVIGNPPYVRIQNMKEWAPIEVELYKEHYAAASKGNYDIYVVFVEKGLSLLNETGRLGFILPSKFLTTDYGAALRDQLAESKAVESLVDFEHEQVFAGASTYTCLLFLDRTKQDVVKYRRVRPRQLMEGSEPVEIVPIGSLTSEPWILLEKKSKRLLERLRTLGVPLLDLPVTMSRGTSSGADEVFCLIETDGKLATRNGERVEIEPEILRRPLYATDFTRYHVTAENDERIIFPYEVFDNGYSVLSEASLRGSFPNAYEYLAANRETLKSRKQCREWYGYSAPRNLHEHDQADLLVPLLADRGLCAPTPEGTDRFCVMASAGFTVKLVVSGDPHQRLYVLALVNSKLLFWNLRLISNKFRGGWITCTKQYFGTLPIRGVDLENRTGRTRYDHMVESVARMITLHGQLACAKAAHDSTNLQRQIDATDRAIDQLVYELYGLTDKEIRIVEESVGG